MSGVPLDNTKELLVELFDLQGRDIIQQLLTVDNSIISMKVSLPAGIYLSRIRHDSNEYKSKLLVIN